MLRQNMENSRSKRKKVIFLQNNVQLVTMQNNFVNRSNKYTTVMNKIEYVHLTVAITSMV